MASSSDTFHLSVEAKVEIVKHFYANKENAGLTRTTLYQAGVSQGKWDKIGVERAPIPSAKAIIRIAGTFSETGCVDKNLLKSYKRQRTITTAENIKRVREEVLKSPDVSKSHRRLSAILGLSEHSIYVILKELKLKPYIQRLSQALNEDDYDRRLEFCETWNGMVSTDSSFPLRILWSDEANFHLSGAVNRHNCVYWRESPPPVVQGKTAITAGVTVWCGLHSRGLVGPVILEEAINQHNYLDILKKKVIPFCDEQFEEILFQQDGASPHYANSVRNYLNEHLPGMWIGRRGSVELPARSPDLSPLDFFFWGAMKDRVYSKKFTDLANLKTAITHEAKRIGEDQELLKKVCLSVTNRVQECIDNNGGPFEQKR